MIDGSIKRKNQFDDIVMKKRKTPWIKLVVQFLDVKVDEKKAWDGFNSFCRQCLKST